MAFTDKGQGAHSVLKHLRTCVLPLRADTHSHKIGRQVWPVRDLVLWFTMGGQREGIYSSFVAVAHNDLKVTGGGKNREKVCVCVCVCGK